MCASSVAPKSEDRGPKLEDSEPTGKKRRKKTAENSRSVSVSVVWLFHVRPSVFALLPEASIAARRGERQVGRGASRLGDADRRVLSLPPQLEDHVFGIAAGRSIGLHTAQFNLTEKASVPSLAALLDPTRALD